MKTHLLATRVYNGNLMFDQNHLECAGKFDHSECKVLTRPKRNFYRWDTNVSMPQGYLLVMALLAVECSFQGLF